MCFLNLWAEDTARWPSGQGLTRCSWHDIQHWAPSSLCEFPRAKAISFLSPLVAKPGLGHVTTSFWSLSASQKTRSESSFVGSEVYTVSLRKRKPNRCRALEEASASVGCWLFGGKSTSEGSLLPKLPLDCETDLRWRRQHPSPCLGALWLCWAWSWFRLIRPASGLLFYFTSEVRPGPAHPYNPPYPSVKCQAWAGPERSLPSTSFWSSRAVYNLIF